MSRKKRDIKSLFCKDNIYLFSKDNLYVESLKTFLHHYHIQKQQH